MKGTKSTHKNQLPYYTLTMNNPERKLRKQSLYASLKKNKILRNKPAMEVNDLYTENYKEIKDANK